VRQHELARLDERPRRQERTAEVALVLRVDAAREVDRVHPERLRDPLGPRRVHLLQSDEVGARSASVPRSTSIARSISIA
jgi:hypothetical protein